MEQPLALLNPDNLQIDYCFHAAVKIVQRGILLNMLIYLFEIIAMSTMVALQNSSI